MGVLGAVTQPRRPPDALVLLDGYRQVHVRQWQTAAQVIGEMNVHGRHWRHLGDAMKPEVRFDRERLVYELLDDAGQPLIEVPLAPTVRASRRNIGRCLLRWNEVRRGGASLERVRRELRP